MRMLQCHGAYLGISTRVNHVCASACGYDSCTHNMGKHLLVALKPTLVLLLPVADQLGSGLEKVEVAHLETFSCKPGTAG